MNETFDRDFLEEALRASRDLADAGIKFRQSLGDAFRSFSSNTMSNLREANKVFDDLNTNQTKYNKYQIKEEETAKKIGKLGDLRVRLEEKISELHKTIIPDLQAQVNLAEHNVTAMAKNKKLSKEEKDAVRDRLRLAQDALETAHNLSTDLDRQVVSIEQANDNLVDYNLRWQEAGKKLGFVGQVLKGIEHIPGLGKILDIKGVTDAMKTIRMGGGSLTQMLAGGFKALPKAFFWLTAIWETAKFIVKLFMTSDKYLTRISRQFVVTKDAAVDILDNYRRMIPTLETQYHTLEYIISAVEEINSLSLFGFDVTQNQIDAQLQLTKEYGLSAEEAAALNKTLYTNNQIGLEGLDVVRRTIQQHMKSNQVIVNTSRTLKKVSEISGELRTRFKGGAAELTNAVLRADKLGISLQQAKAASEGLLDFQSSIESELEAELLLNKSLNFERARMMALNGDYLGAQEDILNQLGGYDELSKMNVIQLKAAAKAAGMSADELSEAAAQQKYLTGEAARFHDQIKNNKVQAKQFMDALTMNQGDFDKTTRQLDAQEKFNIALETAKDTLVSLVANGYLDKIASIVERIATGFTAIFGENNQGIIRDTTREIKTLEEELKRSSINTPDKDTSELKKKLRQQIELRKAAQADESWGGNTLKGSWLQRWFGGTSHLQDVRDKHKLEEPVSDFISRGNTITPFRKDDLIIGGTKLLSGNQQQPQQDNTELVGLLKELITEVKAGKNIYMDSTVVGYTQKRNTFKSA